MGKTITLYRFEDKYGQGCYQTFNVANLHYKHSRNLDKPNIRKDIIGWNSLENSEDYYSACVSMQALFRWFGGFIKPIVREGYKVVKYQVPVSEVKFSYSGKQVVFKKSKNIC